jgi:hypothetical protein
MTSDNKTGIEQEWRQQPLGRQTMSLEEIRAKAKEFDMKVKRWRLVGGLTFAVLLVKNAWEVWTDIEVVERAGDSLMLLALLYVVYRFYRYAGTHLTPAKLGLTECAEHYRSQLVRQRELSRDGWKYIVPFAPGFGLIIFARMLQDRPASQVAALIVGALVLFVGVLWVIARSGRTLDREIAALDSE